MKKIIIGLGALLYLFMSLPAFAFENGDWQIWGDQKIEVGLTEKAKIWIEQEERFGYDVKAIYYIHTEAGLAYQLTNWLNLGANYRQIFLKVRGKWKDEYMPNVYGTVGWDLFGLKFNDRNRLEYRIRKYAKGVLRYRNRLTAIAPLKWTWFEIEPYVSNEFFIDSFRQKYDENRFISGFQFKLFKPLKADVAYMWRATESKGKWSSMNVMVLKIQASF